MPLENIGFHCNRLGHFSEAITDNSLTRGEFYNFPAGDVPKLKKLLLKKDIARSIHTPLVKPDDYPDPPTWSFLCDIDASSRNRTFEMIEQTISYAEDIGAEYIVVHFPTPPTDAKDESDQKRLSIAWKSCERLAELCVKKKISIHIEGLVNSPYLNDDFLTEALGQYPLRYCFDTGHMNLASKTGGFDLYEFAQKMAPFVGSMHLWNNRGESDYRKYRHIGLHPSQEPSQGWADIEKLFEILKPSYPVIFENPLTYPADLGDHDHRDGVKWVKDILIKYF